MDKFLKLLPAILEAVIAVESLVKGARLGRAKKALVMDALTMSAGITVKTGAALDKADIQVAGILVDRAVSTLNQAGFFEFSPETKSATQEAGKATEAVPGFEVNPLRR